VLRITKSPVFVRSEQLPKLLVYICRMAILERFEEINEQHIGVAVFGRSPDYDSAADSIVRSHATRLRQKLEQYFREEGKQEPLRIEIPRGGYVPRFYAGSNGEEKEQIPVPAESSPQSTEAAKLYAPGVSANFAMPEADSASRRPLRPRTIALVSVLATLLIGALLLLTISHLHRDAELITARADRGQTPIERRFWDTMFPLNGRTIIVSGDGGLTLFETVTDHEVSLEDYVDGAYRSPDWLKGKVSEASVELTEDLASRRYTSIVDADIAQQLSHLPQWAANRVSTVFARDLRSVDAATSNLILLGSRQADPWVSLAEQSLNFVLVPDGARGFQFLNRNPHKDELKIYGYKETPSDFGAANIYADVAFLPNPGGQGMILLLSGMWVSATQSAGRFVLDSPRFSAWLKSIANPDGTIPPFELLLSTKNLQGNATYTSIVAHRVRGR
jgi:hypothetical protein